MAAASLPGPTSRATTPLVPRAERPAARSQRRPARRSPRRRAALPRQRPRRPPASVAGRDPGIRTRPFRGPERRVVLEDPALQLAQRRPGLEPELLDQSSAGRMEDVERVGLAPGAVQREHQATRARAHAADAPRPSCSSPATSSAPPPTASCASIRDSSAQSRSSSSRCASAPITGSSSSSTHAGPTPQPERVVEHSRGGLRVPTGLGAPGAIHEPLELVDVPLARLDTEPIPAAGGARCGHDPAACAAGRRRCRVTQRRVAAAASPTARRSAVRAPRPRWGAAAGPPEALAAWGLRAAPAARHVIPRAAPAPKIAYTAGLNQPHAAVARFLRGARGTIRAVDHTRPRGFAVPARFRLLLLALTTSVAHGRSGSRPGARLEASPASRFGFGSSLVGSAPTGTSPSALAVDPATHTIYVANGYNDNGPFPGGNTVSVIDARRCQARRRLALQGAVADDHGREACRAGSRSTSTPTRSTSPTPATTRSRCSTARPATRETTSGCGQTPATVPVGSAPLGLVFDDPATTPCTSPTTARRRSAAPRHSTTVSMLDSATCNATDLPRCPTDRRRRRSTSARRPTTSTSTSRRTPCTCTDPDRPRGQQRLVGVRREHLQRHRAVGLRLARRSCPAIQSAPTPRRSTPPTTRSTPPTTTTRSRRSTGPSATPATWRAAPPTRPGP